MLSGTVTQKRETPKYEQKVIIKLRHDHCRTAPENLKP